MKYAYALVPALALAAAVAMGDEAAVAVPVGATDAVASEATATATTPVAGAVEIGLPEAGKGQIVFFRPAKMTGAVIGFKVREDGKELGVLKNGNYFVLAVEPGKHEYVVHSEAKDKLVLEVEAGEVYYVSGSISMGLLAGRPNLSPSDAATFEGVRAKLKQSSL